MGLLASRTETPLPSQQHAWEGKARLDEHELHWRREWLFLILSGTFLGTLAMLNILGITRFIDLSFTVLGVTVPMSLAVGVLPYPVTFLCTDLISELYGQRRANSVVWMGLVLNLWVAFILWIGGILPGVDNGGSADEGVFMQVRTLTFAAVTASMIAYITAQFVDVQLFHFWKKLTKGKHLWLRNNGSTLVSQLVDTVAVILITHYLANGLPLDPAEPVGAQLMTFIASGYVFKLLAALADTGPFYVTAGGLRRFLRLPPAELETQ